ncbi:biotin--[acetyl-CoA-carboxylase] ligase [Ulvibacter sp. MAR_2010_11]|uniref:biotin--[acetyl-CoA-carboxylase] ligase n=1 Tax=Ulvibacter sp. MAR_2010_11 TaxID=1250229 RepID=UPI0012FD37DC|nr:biotin--[acetyl-CoA-carboxylase] ligase [Ulvibacter sp. MAR_2010_11]
MKIIKLNAIDSTNTYLKELGKDLMLEDGVIVITKKQTKGRGQMGAHWQSKSGESLTFSMFKRFSSLPIEHQAGITFAVALGVKSALKKLQIPGISVKWPNDIMSYQKKLAGILIENQFKSNVISSSVIGIGLNVNETKFENLPQATSMRLNTGVVYNLDEVLTEVSEAVMIELQRVEGGDFLKLKSDYEKVLFRKNKVSVFENEAGQQFNGIIKGISEEGFILIEAENETLQQFRLKEIKMLF